MLTDAILFAVHFTLFPPVQVLGGGREISKGPGRSFRQLFVTLRDFLWQFLSQHVAAGAASAAFCAAFSPRRAQKRVLSRHARRFVRQVSAALDRSAGHAMSNVLCATRGAPHSGQKSGVLYRPPRGIAEKTSLSPTRHGTKRGFILSSFVRAESRGKSLESSGRTDDERPTPHSQRLRPYTFRIFKENRRIVAHLHPTTPRGPFQQRFLATRAAWLESEAHAKRRRHRPSTAGQAGNGAPVAISTREVPQGCRSRALPTS